MKKKHIVDTGSQGDGKPNAGRFSSALAINVENVGDARRKCITKPIDALAENGSVT